MNRRDSLKTFFVTTIGGGLSLTTGCRTDADQTAAEQIVDDASDYYGRTPKEAERDERLHEEEFFRAHELVTLTALANIIMPPSEHGGIEEADVPGFIEFMAKDRPDMQGPLRAGIAYIDREAMARHGKSFDALTEQEYKPILDEIAYEPEDTAVPTEAAEVKLDRERKFFSLLRSLVVTGYFTSQVGVADLGYQGNVPNTWDGVPPEVLAKHGVAYDEEWLAKCVDQEKRGETAVWDEAGNLLT